MNSGARISGAVIHFKDIAYTAVGLTDSNFWIPGAVTGSMPEARRHGQ